VRWVLGEQSARQLRGARMDEVIFAGNNRRRPLGMAEVTLTFDNSDGTLASPFAEIAVTRRVYRTGEGEYFLNHAQVRLRDIIDLLLGTGLGPDASAIISQGQIDAILSAKPEERREIFEEAAGTSKYQSRKREAQRRLEQTEQNALRINDVLAEIEQQVPALETQVRRAKRYRKASSLLRDLEILSFLRKTSARRDERRQLAETLGAEESAKAHSDAERERQSAHANHLRYEEYQSTVALDERSQARSDQAAALQDAATAVAASQARLEDADRRCIDLAREVETAALAVDEAQARIDLQSRELGQSRERRDAAMAAAEAAATEERGGAKAWETAYGALREAEDRRAIAAADAAESDTASQAAQAHRRRLEERATSLEGEIQSLSSLITERRNDESSCAQRAEELDSSMASLEKERDAAISRRDDLGSALERTREGAERAHINAAQAAARLAALREFESAGAGLPAGVKAVLAGKDDKRSGVVGVVADLIEVDAAFATAVDVALGPRAHDVVTERADDAQKAVEALRRDRAGVATFLPLEMVRRYPAPPKFEIPASADVVGRAADLVHCSPNVAPIVQHLLRDAVIVKSLTAALDLAKKIPTAVIVTLDGELVSRAAITGGTGVGESGPLVRRAQIARLVEETEAAEAGAKKADEELSRVRESSLEATAQVERASAACIDVQLARRDVEAAMLRARDERATLEHRRESLSGELTQTHADFERSKREEARYAERASVARSTIESLEEQRRSAAARADELLESLSGLRDRHRSAAAEAAALVERVAQAGDDVEAAREAHRACVQAHEDKRNSMAAERAKRDRGRADAVELAVKKTAAEEELASIESDVTALRAKRDQLAASARAVEEAIATAASAAQARSMEFERHRIRQAEIEAELAVLQETFAQNPATPEECDAVAQRHADFAGEADVEIRRLRDEVARLGNVNLNALEDHVALLERREFLRKQLGDLEAARASILSSIAEIDAESVKQFNATFEMIAQAFSETFAKLFTGGVGKIWLAESADPTQAGIEVAAAPPGKKMQSLNLLSGGERAMTAVALIFAILKVRPSPFYIFDEIDAALDEANIGRFGSLLAGVAQRAQTIIITHNKATMTLADRIYGVTMGEPGVSNVLSLALEQVSA